MYQVYIYIYCVERYFLFAVVIIPGYSVPTITTVIKFGDFKCFKVYYQYIYSPILRMPGI